MTNENLESISYGYALALIDEFMILNGDNPRDSKFSLIREKSARELSRNKDIINIICEVKNNIERQED